MNNDPNSTTPSTINLDALSDEQLAKIKNESSKIMAEREKSELKKWKANTQKEAKQRGLKVTFISLMENKS